MTQNLKWWEMSWKINSNCSLVVCVFVGRLSFRPLKILDFFFCDYFFKCTLSIKNANSLRYLGTGFNDCYQESCSWYFQFLLVSKDCYCFAFENSNYFLMYYQLGCVVFNEMEFWACLPILVYMNFSLILIKYYLLFVLWNRKLEE